MRKQFSKIVLAAILGIAMVFTLSCSDGDGDEDTTVTALEGTWEASGGRVAIFAGNTFEYKVNGVTQHSGTFSISGTTITCIVSGGKTVTAKIQISGETITISDHPESSVNGTYTKVH